MEIKVNRVIRTSIATISVLTVNNDIVCYTLEDTDRFLEMGGIEKIPGKTAIPKGRYRVRMTHSQRFGKVMPQIMDVPDFLGVRIHCGNTPTDTEGCLLVGMTHCAENPNRIGDSRKAYDKLVPMIEKAIAAKEPVWLEIK